MKLSQLRNLVSVAEAGSVRQAARDLNLSQSAVSKSIQQLEEEVGATLLYRQSHSVRPTTAGEALIKRAKSIDGELRAARTEIQDIQEVAAGDLRITASPTVASSLLPRALLGLARRRPKLRIHVEESFYPDNLLQVRNGDMDAAICLVPNDRQEEELESEILLEDYLVPAVRRDHPAATSGAIDLGKLVDYEWLVFGRRGGQRVLLEESFRRYGLQPPRVSIESTSYSCATAIIEQSDYVALMPYHLVSESADRSHLVPLQLDKPIRSWTIAVFVRSFGSMPPVCRDFITELRRQAHSSNRLGTA